MDPIVVIAPIATVAAAIIGFIGYRFRERAKERRERDATARDAFFAAREAWDQAQLPDLPDAVRQGRLDAARRELTRLRATLSRADSAALRCLIGLLGGSQLARGYPREVQEARECWTTVESEMIDLLRD